MSVKVHVLIPKSFSFFQITKIAGQLTLIEGNFFDAISHVEILSWKKLEFGENPSPFPKFDEFLFFSLVSPLSPSLLSSLLSPFLSLYLSLLSSLLSPLFSLLLSLLPCLFLLSLNLFPDKFLPLFSLSPALRR